MSINPLNDISKVYLEQVADMGEFAKEEFEFWVNELVEEGYDLSDYTWEEMLDIYLDEAEGSYGATPKAYSAASKTKMTAKRKPFLKKMQSRTNPANRTSPYDSPRKGLTADDRERARAGSVHGVGTRQDHDYPSEGPGGVTKNPKKLRKQKAMGELGESAVPGKPAEKLGAVTAIPKSEQEEARERILAKTKAKREKALDPVGQEDADIDNDGDTDKTDKYLHNRRKAIGKAIAKKKGVKESSHYDPMEDPDFDHDEAEENRGVSGKNNPKGGKALGKKKKNVKEGFSNWRQDLSEVMTDEIDSKPIKEKKVNNKIKVNPTLGEAVEEIGGTLIEMVEIEDLEGVLDDLSESEIFLLKDNLIEEVVEEVFFECLDEGYELDEIENVLIESLEISSALLNEAKVTLGHDTKIKSDRLEKVKSAVKKTGKAIARGAGYVAGAAVRGAKAVKREFGKGYERGRGGSSSSSSTSSSSSSSSSGSSSSSSSETGTKRPGLLGRIGSKLKSGLKKAVAKGARAVSRGARNVARKLEGGETKKAEAPKAAPKKAEKPADPWGEPTTPPKAKAKPKAATKKAAAPKAKAPARKKKASKLDSLLSDIRNEETIQELTDLQRRRYLGRKPGESKERLEKSNERKDKKAVLAAMEKQYRGMKAGIYSSYEPKGEQLDEKTLTDAEMKKREEIVKSMKDKASDFEKRYPGRGKEVMYATATKMAKKMAEQALPTAEPAIDQKKEMMDKQKLANMKMLQQKQQMLQRQRLQMQRAGKLPLEAN